MASLKNARHELFAQGLAQGKPAAEAYVLAGYRADDGNATRLTGKDKIQARVSEILLGALRKNEGSIERIAEEVRRIAVYDVTDMVSIVKGDVEIKDTADLPVEFRSAIASIKKTKDGVEVKFHDKLAALSMLGKHKGMFKENLNLTVSLSIADLVNASYQPAEKAKPEKD